MNRVDAPALAIDRYQIVKVLGEGAIGRVYLATDPKLNRQVAIKVLVAEADEPTRHRFRLEARAIAALKHPNIVALFDYSGERSADLYLVMEYVPGPSLFALTRDHGPMSEATALCIGHEVALALEHAHSHKVVHRDIKPENLLLADGRLVVTDFGVVKAIAAKNAMDTGSISARTEALGTPGFMPPEQFAGKSIGPQTDIFSLGASLYNLTTGQIPYEGGSIEGTYNNLKAGKYVDPRNHHRLLSPEFAQLLAHCLAPRAKDRFPSAKVLRAQILQLLNRSGVVEIRSELARYEESPAQSVVTQRERAVDGLMREIKDALGAHDVKKAVEVAERIKEIAPLDARAEQIAGLDNATRVMRARDTASRGQFVLGLLIGLLVGLSAVAIPYLLELLPPDFLWW